MKTNCVLFLLVLLRVSTSSAGSLRTNSGLSLKLKNKLRSAATLQARVATQFLRASTVEGTGKKGKKKKGCSGDPTSWGKCADEATKTVVKGTDEAVKDTIKGIDKTANVVGSWTASQTSAMESQIDKLYDSSSSEFEAISSETEKTIESTGTEIGAGLWVAADTVGEGVEYAGEVITGNSCEILVDSACATSLAALTAGGEEEAAEAAELTIDESVEAAAGSESEEALEETLAKELAKSSTVAVFVAAISEATGLCETVVDEIIASMIAAGTDPWTGICVPIKECICDSCEFSCSDDLS